MSEKGDTSLSDDTTEDEVFSPESRLRDEIDVAFNQREQLDDLVLLLKSRRRSDLWGVLAMLSAGLLTIIGALVQYAAFDPFRQFLPAAAVLILFGIYHAWAAFLETSQNLSRLHLLTRRVEAAVVEANEALLGSAAGLSSNPGNAG